ncbi:MAG: hypothetical protein JW913_11020 [Chitinispirillaceae bacterium]|nr:hypothetical protein [Chitinispirillaceae bacterium]
MVNYSNAEFGFTPYYFGDIEIDRQNKICCAIDYLLSSGRYGPQLMIFNGESAEQLQYDSVSIVSSITVDDQDTIRCFGMGGNYAVYDGEEWSVNDSSFIEKGIFAIEQAPDGKMWVGTGDGIYISD